MQRPEIHANEGQANLPKTGFLGLTQRLILRNQLLKQLMGWLWAVGLKQYWPAISYLPLKLLNFLFQK